MKKLVLLMQSVFLFILSGCGVLMEVYRPIYNNDAYFITKSGKIKNPYQLNRDEKSEIATRGWKVEGESKYKYIYSNDRLGGLYNRQFIKPDIPELSVDLVKLELDVQGGGSEPEIRKLYLCDREEGGGEIKELNNLLKNNYSELEEAVNQEVDRFTQRSNMKTEILSTRTISYKDKGRIKCDNYVRMSVKILKQQEFPEITIGMNMEYLGDGKNKQLKPTKETQKAHDEIFKRIMNSYFQFEAKKEKFLDYQKRLTSILGGDYIFRMKNDSLKNGVNEEVFPGYHFDNGISIRAELSDYDSVTPLLEKYVQPDFSEIQKMKNGKFPEHVAIEIRPTKESEVVSPEKLKELRKEMNLVSEAIFGYEIGVDLEVYASFRVVKTGISEQTIGNDEFYKILA